MITNDSIPALIGYRATGKTSVGNLLAQMLGWKCVDTDAEIVKRAGCSIAEMFRQQGEGAFRDLESLVIDEVTQQPEVVVSLGGGAILREQNRNCINKRCSPVVWLQASVETIEARIHADSLSASQRPNLTKQGGILEIQQILKERTPLYASTATICFDTELQSPAEIADRIFEAMQCRS